MSDVTTNVTTHKAISEGIASEMNLISSATDTGTGYASATLEVIDNTSLTGTIITIEAETFTEGVEWNVGVDKEATMRSIVSGINGKSSFVHAVYAGGLITVTSLIWGVAGNAYTMSYSAMMTYHYYGYPTYGAVEPNVAAQWLCDEGSGNLIDEVAGRTLTAQWVPTYNNAIAGEYVNMTPGVGGCGVGDFILDGAADDTALSPGASPFVWEWTLLAASTIAAKKLLGSGSASGGMGGHPATMFLFHWVDADTIRFTSGVNGSYSFAEDIDLTSTFGSDGLPHQYRLSCTPGGPVTLYIDGIFQKTTALNSETSIYFNRTFEMGSLSGGTVCGYYYELRMTIGNTTNNSKNNDVTTSPITLSGLTLSGGGAGVDTPVAFTLDTAVPLTTPVDMLLSVNNDGDPKFQIDISGNVVTVGTVDGVDVSAISATLLPLSGGTMTGDLVMDNQKGILFREFGSTNYAKIQAPASLGGDYTLTLPVDDGTSNQVLTTNGSGVLSWTTSSSSSVVNRIDASLQMAIGAANSLRTIFLAHAADAGEHTKGADTVSFAAMPAAASGLTSLITLVTYQLTSYKAHDDDAKKGTPDYHQAQYGGSSPADVTAPTTLAEALVDLIDLKAKYNVHDANPTAHDVGSQHQETRILYSYSTTITDYIIEVSNTVVAPSIVLSTADMIDGRIMMIKDKSGAASIQNITISTQGSEDIDGADTYVINGNYNSITLYSDGVNWFLV